LKSHPVSRFPFPHKKSAAEAALFRPYGGVDYQ
jgi:hypothetical protein